MFPMCTFLLFSSLLCNHLTSIFHIPFLTNRNLQCVIPLFYIEEGYLTVCITLHLFPFSHVSHFTLFQCSVLHCQLLSVLSHCARSRSISLFTISWPVYHPLSGKSAADRALALVLFSDSRTRRQLASFFSLLCGAFIRKELAKQSEAEQRQRQKQSK